MIHSKIQLGFSSYLQRQIRSAMADWLSRLNSQRDAAKIACFPRDYIGKQIVANGLYEDLILHCLFEQTFATRLPLFKSTTVLDVGANIGNHSTWFARYFDTVLAFEPHPICVRLFEATALMNRLPNVKLYPCGLSDRDGVAVMHANLDGNLGGSGLGKHREGAAMDSFEIPLRRGDSVLAEAPASSPVSLIKIDVEGHEHAVILGLEQTIRKDKPIIVFEAQGTQGDNGSMAILQTLKNMGYRRTYLVHANSSRSTHLMARLWRRATQRFEMQVVEVEYPEDRFYNLIVASVDPL